MAQVLWSLQGLLGMEWIEIFTWLFLARYDIGINSVVIAPEKREGEDAEKRRNCQPCYPSFWLSRESWWCLNGNSIAVCQSWVRMVFTAWRQRFLVIWLVTNLSNHLNMPCFSSSSPIPGVKQQNFKTHTLMWPGFMLSHFVSRVHTLGFMKSLTFPQSWLALTPEEHQELLQVRSSWHRTTGVGGPMELTTAMFPTSPQSTKSTLGVLVSFCAYLFSTESSNQALWNRGYSS